MKKTYMKKLVVACVATIAFIGIHNSTVEAITEYPVAKGDIVWEFGQEYGPINDTKQENNHKDNEILDKSTKPKEETIDSNKPDMDNASKTTDSEAQAVEPAEEPTVEPTVEPAVETPVEEVEEPAVSVSPEEKDLFARLVEAEAKGESYEGKVAVATVVLNRVESPEFPNTVTGVIKEVVGDSYAFSPVQNGEINNQASDEAKQAVEEALTRQDRLNDCIYFYNPEIATDDWIRSRTVVKTIGNHVFAK
jgi:N-acetylmuramoyl-L-alanine amidase